MLSTVNVIVYSKPGCHLCEEAKHTLMSSACRDLFTLSEINIETDPELKKRYQYDIPVVSINGVETFMHRVGESEFCANIRELANGLD